ncbi:AAA family ATPase [Endozoicomonadaceae bacterium StTr2]
MPTSKQKTFTVLILYGLPGVGKYTVAQKLAERLKLPNWHNHASLDAVTPLFAHATQPYCRLRNMIWLHAFRLAAAQQLSFIHTFCTEKSVPTNFHERLRRIILTAGGQVHYIQLLCPEPILEERLANKDRARFRKLRDVQTYQRLKQQGFFHFDMPAAPLISIDTARLEPDVSVECICEALARENPAWHEKLEQPSEY